MNRYSYPHESEEEIREGWKKFLGIDIFAPYFWFKSFEKRVKEKYLTLHLENNNEEKQTKRIKKIKTDFKKDYIRFKFDFYEYKGKKKTWEIKFYEPWRGEIRVETRFTIRF